ncbi:serine/threonine protein kinase [Coccidioides immitis RS]|uniref:Serine/threonine protein kinase n=1 Tax=Coccidioides immitis (strain RS) TaxID=246410 RepID=J3KBG6_COCIM|nr:serine/threonine protein kinase [Coccidioides immitis RS]EAS32459.3 serine/threonine protein kinase [Coccidioides immitis RS]
MPEITSRWWPDERVDATVSRDYVLKTLDPALHSRLDRYPSFGKSLTDDSYIDWILERARKLYLVLLEINFQDRIFHLIDHGYDDADLPITRENTANLRLSSMVKDVFLDWRFPGVQRQYLVRSIPEGEHTRFHEHDLIPLKELHRQKIPISFPDSFQVDRVVHAGSKCREVLRLKFTLDEVHFCQDEQEILREVRALRPFAHEHIMSVFGSYSVGDTLNVLLSGSPECTLKSFLKDRPSSFKHLSKDDQLSVLLNWPHCLASGLAWLHDHGQCHGAIRPSNVFIDSESRIFLGFFDSFNPLIPQKQPNNMETYQYAAPEQKSNVLPVTPTLYPQSCPPSRPGTAKRDDRPPNAMQNNAPGWSPAGFFSRSPASKRHSKISLTRSTSSSSNASSSHNSIARRNIPSFTSQSTMSTSSSNHFHPATPKLATIGTLNSPNNLNLSNYGNDGSGRNSSERRPGTLPLGHHVPASDVFCLAAISLDILTCVCKKKQSAFVNHRGAKNRTPGYGGNIPDASFHLARNTEQIFSWMDILEREASKQKGSYYRAVSPLLAVVKDMLARNPEVRPSSGQVAARFARAICSVASDFEPHCRFHPEAAMNHRDSGESNDNSSLENKHSSYSSFSSGPNSFPLTPDTVAEVPSEPRRQPLLQLDPVSRSPSSCYSFRGEENEHSSHPAPHDHAQQPRQKHNPVKPVALDLDIIDDEEIGLGIDIDAGFADLEPHLRSNPPPGLHPSNPTTVPFPPWHSPSNPCGQTLPTNPNAKPLNHCVAGDHLTPAPLSFQPIRSAPHPEFLPPRILDSDFSPAPVIPGYIPSRSRTPNEGGRTKLQKFPRSPVTPWKVREADQIPQMQVPVDPPEFNLDSVNRRGYPNFSRHRTSVMGR